MTFWLHDTFSTFHDWDKDFVSGRFYDCIMDSHHYEVFDETLLKQSVDCHIKNVCEIGERAGSYVRKNTPLVFGEFSAALTDCAIHCKIIVITAVNGYKVGNRMDGTYPEDLGYRNEECAESHTPIAEWTKERKDNVRRFIEAQLDAYDIANGWMFWTAKTEPVAGSDSSWDMGQLVEHGVFPQPFNERKFNGCNVVHPNCG